MERIVIENIDALDAIRMKNTLIEHGLVLDVDFKYFYHPTSEKVVFQEMIHKHVEFYFKDSGLAAMYKLMWS